jgi:hypothetical protein
MITFPQGTTMLDVNVNYISTVTNTTQEIPLQGALFPVRLEAHPHCKAGRKRRYVTPRRRFLKELYGVVISQKRAFFIVTVVRTSYLMQKKAVYE